MGDQDNGGSGPQETRLNPEAATQVGNDLITESSAVLDSGFGNVALQDHQFSSLPKGVELGTEHSISYQIMLETMNGFAKDLEHYGEAIRASASGLTDTDQDAAVMLNRMAVIAPTTNDQTSHDNAWGNSGLPYADPTAPAASGDGGDPTDPAGAPDGEPS